MSCFAPSESRVSIGSPRSAPTVLKNPDLIELAADAGCFWLVIGMESPNRAILGTVDKGFNKVEEYGEFVDLCRRAGIVPFPSFIFEFDHD